MSAYRYCASCKETHDVSAWPPLCMSSPPKRSDLSAPMLIRDSMDPVQSMLDGRMYESKSALRATYKAAGVTEVGNDPQRLKPMQKTKADRKEIRKTIGKAIADHKMGRRSKPLPRTDAIP